MGKKIRKPRWKVRSFRPMVEALEDRTLPAVRASMTGTLLRVTGDNASNNIRIAQAQGGAISVIGVGQFRGVRRILVNGNGGNDTIQILGSVPNTIRTTLNGGAGRDNLLGGTGRDVMAGGGGNDSFSGGLGNDVMNGGAGFDRIVETANVSRTLSATTLTGRGTDSHSGIEQASLTGGNGGNSLSAAAFNGSVTLRGLGGNDTLSGGAVGDILDGGTGLDEVRQTANVNWVLTNALLTGQGADTLVSIERANLTGGDGANTFNALGFTGNATLNGGDGNDTFQGGTGNDAINGGNGTDRILLTLNVNMTLSNTGLNAVGAGNDAISSIEEVILTGGAANNLFDASSYTGSVTLIGGVGDDTLRGGSGDDELEGGAGNDSLSGGNGIDEIIEESGDVDFILTNSLLIGVDTETLSGIDRVALTAGPSDNLMDATGFSGSVTLIGGDGNDTLGSAGGSDSLDGGNGIDRLLAEGASFILTDTTMTSGINVDTLVSLEDAILTGGTGADVLDSSGFSGFVTLLGMEGNDTLVTGAGNDSLDGGSGTDRVAATGDSFTLTDGVLIGLGTDLLNSIEEASLTGGAADDILDASVFTGDVTLTGGDGADALLAGSGDDQLVPGLGDDLVDGGAGTDLLVDGGGSYVLTNSFLFGAETDVLTSIERASLTGGAGADVLDSSSFSGNVTLVGGDGNDTFVNGAGNDSLDGGAGTDRVLASGGSFTVKDNSLSGLGTDILLNIEEVSLTGGNGADTLNALNFSGNATLVGGNGNDTFIGGIGNDSFVGGLGTDRVVASGGSFTLTDALLTGQGTDALVDIEEASLSGGNAADNIDASAFTLGNVTLVGGIGNDTLRGGSGDDILRPGLGDDSLDGGLGTDRVVEVGGSFTLTNANLTGLGNDSLTSVEQASLTGGTGADSITAATFGGEVTLVGGLGNDTLVGSDQDDQFTGGPGDDSIEGNNGIDLLVEVGASFTLTNNSLVGLGNDLLVNAEIENASLTGGNDNDTIDWVGFTVGNVTVNGGAGNDTLIDGASDDLINGGDGTDRVVATGANFTVTDSLLTGVGTDTLSFIEEVFLTGSGAADLIDASATTANVSLDGGDGADTLLGGFGNDTIDGGNDADRLIGNFGSDSIRGGAGNDYLLGADSPVTDPIDMGEDSMFGEAGTDTIQGGLYDDFIDGGDDPDDLRGGFGDNEVHGGLGNDTIVTHSGDDTVFGEDGNDLIAAGLGDDSVLGGDGDDWMFAQEGDDFMAGGAGNDTLEAGDGDDSMRGDAGDDSIHGGRGEDRLDGGDDNDQVFGDESNDELFGGRGNDSLEGGENDDFLWDHEGSDTLNGGADGDWLDTREEDPVIAAAGPDTLYANPGEFTIVDAFDTVDATAPVVTVDPLTTSDDTPLITGTINDASLAEGVTLTVIVDGETYSGSDVVIVGNTWSVQIPAINALADGIYDVEVIATDIGGNTATDSTLGELIIDTNDPVVTIFALTTDDTTPTLTGTWSDSTLVTVDVNIVGVGNFAATVVDLGGGFGTWELTVPVALAPNTYDVIVTATDGGGNQGTDPLSNELTITP